MKKYLVLVAIAIALIVMSLGCMLPMTGASLSIRTTNMPFLSRNQVVVTCPTNLSLIKAEKVDQWGAESFAVRPGSSTSVRASGMYSDQAFVLTVYGYREAGKNEKGETLFTLVGRTSREFRFYDSGNSGQIIAWDVQASELR